ncbi:hypothetical protein PPROV_000239200 [Pycnococcus provasolii]|uniref:RBR-type E3 ubiquitin transferase n=1 Tax=Pycnococcus provasolii TaxID=41880 RepID=A0A830HEV1_9CHLO|nr:hypothetical protein PPROV_000239200 [Pycnococcus provasolii]
MHARRVTRARLRDGDNEPAALEANARGAAGTSASAATNKREERGVKMQNAEAAPVAGNHDAKNKKRTASARNRAAPKGGDATATAQIKNSPRKPPSSPPSKRARDVAVANDDGSDSEVPSASEAYYGDSDVYASDDNGYFDDVEQGATRSEKAPGDTADIVAVCSSFDEAQRVAQQDKLVKEAEELLGLDANSALLLLRSNGWDLETMLERYMENPSAVCDAAGVYHASRIPSGEQDDAAAAAAASAAAAGAGAGAGANSPSAVCGERLHVSVPRDFECAICRDVAPDAASSLACGHLFCDTCWATYLTMKVNDGETDVGCPHEGCRLKVGPSFVDAHCDRDVSGKYRSFLADSFVDRANNVVWCPSPNCGLCCQLVSIASPGGGGSRSAAEASTSGSSRAAPEVDPTFVTCGNGHTFCSSCLHPEMHAPAPCNVVKRWLKKCRDDSETANWLSANTQDCPKCQSTIEKNGGCNHMTCRKCKHEFCWVCMQPWQDHKDYYSCNRYEASTEKQKEGTKAASRAALDRYLFYYHRFMNHEQSRKLERCTRLAAEQKMEALLTRKVSDGKRAQWTDGQFIGTATDELMACRLVLKWTYVLAHHLKDNSRPKNLFCDLQTQLESHTERLSGLIESDVEQLIKPEVRQEVLSLTGVAKDNRKKLLNGIKGILLDGSNLIEAHDDDDDDDNDDDDDEKPATAGGASGAAGAGGGGGGAAAAAAAAASPQRRKKASA